MKSMTILGLAIAAVGLGSSTSEAALGRVFFGKQETLHRLTDVALEGSNGEDLVLSFKTSQLFLGLGIYCKSDGYILTKADDSNDYYPIRAMEPDLPLASRWPRDSRRPVEAVAIIDL